MRQIIILNNQVNPDNSITVNYVYWLPVPASIQKAISITSKVPDATTAESTALQNGSVIEQVNSGIFTVLADIQGQLIRNYNNSLQLLNKQGNMKNYSGVYWDGTSWFNIPA